MNSNMTFELQKQMDRISESVLKRCNKQNGNNGEDTFGVGLITYKRAFVYGTQLRDAG